MYKMKPTTREVPAERPAAAASIASVASVASNASVATAVEAPPSMTFTEETETASIAPPPSVPPRTLYKLNIVKKALDQSLNYAGSNNSTICDIIAMYLKGQKVLYTESKTVCEQRLNFLMLPAIFITAVCTILSLVLKEYDYGPTIVSSLNGVNVFLLAVVNYLKLDAKAEAHRTSAYKFDKLQSYMEFNSGKILFLTDKSKELEKIITQTESAVQEIKETNQFILPETIRFAYPKSYNMNVFAEVKKLQNKELILVNKLKDCMNEYNYIYNNLQSPPHDPELITRLDNLDRNQKTYTNQIIEVKNEYYEIDKKSEDEMSVQRNKMKTRLELFGWLKT